MSIFSVMLLFSDITEKTLAGRISQRWFHRAGALVAPRGVLQGRLDGCRDADVTGPGMKPWDHLGGSASCGRPPSPPHWGPLLGPDCCTAASSHPAAAARPPASPSCPLLLTPERRKPSGGQPEKSTRADVQTETWPHLLQFLLFLLFTFWIAAVRSVFLVLFVFLFLLLFHHLIPVHLRMTFTSLFLRKPNSKDQEMELKQCSEILLWV